MLMQDLVLPSLNSFLVMLVLGLVAFLAEVILNPPAININGVYKQLTFYPQLKVCWARGLQLEKTNKVANVRFLEVFLLVFSVYGWLFFMLLVALNYENICIPGCTCAIVAYWRIESGSCRSISWNCTHFDLYVLDFLRRS